jgi:kanamycin kinase/streptomycin 3"-kinase/aminoglycoside 3'-phosphotransferase-2
VSGSDWETITTGMSGAEVRRSPDGNAYAKTGSGVLRRDLVAERERLQWLSGTDLPAATILDWADDGETATLTLCTVPGVPMNELSASDSTAAVEALGRFLARIHATTRESCPFERWLAVTVPVVRVRVAEGLVDEDDFDSDHEGRSADDLLTELVDLRPRAEELEVADLVVCHGDACLPNFLVDPGTFEVTGMIDVHRLGVADRHLDLALATRSTADTTLNPVFGPDAVKALVAAYGREVDPWRVDFYRLLDEFF